MVVVYVKFFTAQAGVDLALSFSFWFSKVSAKFRKSYENRGVLPFIMSAEISLVETTIRNYIIEKVMTENVIGKFLLIR
jgi:hypothetical protein